MRSLDGPESGGEPACTTLSEATRTVTRDLFGPTDAEIMRRGTVATFGVFELTAWRRWYGNPLTTEEGRECKDLSFAVLETATPREQSLRITEDAVADVRVEIRSDFASPSETAELSFDVQYDVVTGWYVPSELGMVCGREASTKYREVWYTTTGPSNSGARLIAVEDGWLAVIPFRSSTGCAVVEYYAPAAM